MQADPPGHEVARNQNVSIKYASLPPGYVARGEHAVGAPAVQAVAAVVVHSSHTGLSGEARYPQNAIVARLLCRFRSFRLRIARCGHDHICRCRCFR